MLAEAKIGLHGSFLSTGKGGLAASETAKKLSDPERGPVVQYGKEHDVITVQGPFDLKQGGKGIAIRAPVFLSDGSFWGFTIAVVDATELIDSVTKTMEAVGCRDSRPDHLAHLHAHYKPGAPERSSESSQHRFPDWYPEPPGNRRKVH